MAVDPEQVFGQLPHRWADMCRKGGTLTFNWANDGVKKNGFVRLEADGRLATVWCEGTWRVVVEDPDCLDLSFGSSRHICRLRDGGFICEQKFLLRSGKSSYRPDQPHSCGFLAIPGAEKEPRQKRVPHRRLMKELSSGDEGEAVPTFDHAELRFDVFYDTWFARKRQRLAEAAERRQRLLEMEASTPIAA